MRFSLITVFFFLFAVYASPVAVTRPAGTTVAKSESLPHAVQRRAPPAVKAPAKAPAKNSKPSTGTKCGKKKRNNGPVAEAAHSRTTRVGGGNTGDVYKTTFQGKEAVIKVIDASRPGGSLDSVKKEISNLKSVNQFLGWGEKKNDQRDPGHHFYIVMPNMGVSGKDTGLPDADLAKLVTAANKHYVDKFHMENRDKNPNNYVFRKVGGKWEAEIIDWARAIYTGKTPQPAPGTPEVVTDPAKCTIM